MKGCYSKGRKRDNNNRSRQTRVCHKENRKDRKSPGRMTRKK